jgi:hypothetical protein
MLGITVGGSSMTDAYLWSPATGDITPTAALATARANPGLTLLANGRVLIAGGHGGALMLNELYVP